MSKQSNELQTSVENINDEVDSKYLKLSGDISKLDGIHDEILTIKADYDNILDPNNIEYGYYDNEGGTGDPINNKAYVRTKKLIRLPENYIDIYIINNFDDSSFLMCILFYDENKQLLRSYGGRGTSLGTSVNNALYINVWVKSDSLDAFNNICVSSKRHNTIQQYKISHAVSKKAIPGVYDTIDIVNSIFTKGPKNNNILDPSSQINGLISLDDGYTINSASSFIINDFIKIRENTNYLYLNCTELAHTYTTNGIGIYCYDKDKNYLGYVFARTPASGWHAYALKSGTVYIRAWLNMNAIDMSEYSLWYEACDYVVYESVQKISDDYISDEVKSAKPVLDFENKIILNFGDSIFGNARPPQDISTRLAEITGATVHNLGFGGCRMSNHSRSWNAFSMCNLVDSIVAGDFSVQDEAIANTSTDGLPSYFAQTVELLKSIDFSKVDYATIAYGTNDFTAAVSLENQSDLYSKSSFAGAMRYSIETLLNAFPNIKLFICSQTYRFWMDSDKNFTEDSDSKVINSVKLTDFVAKTKEVAEAYHLPFINNYNIGMNKFTRSVYFSSTDGTHPILIGRHLMADHIAKNLF